MLRSKFNHEHAAELRKRLKTWYREHDEIERHNEATDDHLPFPLFPEECRGMVCGAHARTTGRPCQRRDLWPNGRCKLHGGPSTGPRGQGVGDGN